MPLVPDIVIESLPRLMGGTWVTIQITALSVLIGLCLAVPVALMRVAKSRMLSVPSYVFCFYFRGTPLLVQIFLIYYGSGQFVDLLQSVGLWQFFRQAYFCAVLTLTLNTAAYTAEILRGAIEAVPWGEVEAARACGMNTRVMYRRIILPKAFRLAWPAYTNEVVFLLQATSLVSIITVMDLTGVTRVISARSFAFYEMFIAAALIYLVLVYGVLFVFRRIERRITSHMQAVS
ncbi:amino acid ABC transporter permease [Desulfosarcina widdelii]|uniref:Amino acid ABC transporter permease n=1 Tax=Desulfosarcina widdelii TaxID=947919 RepID=A0A5K7ZGZ2_9BACT|nr:ABC transporter permease [Desulfosarcina widdelii]BBO79071.1 amino acid ABC transporter permease [Desulfosarcina widdelii]